MTLSKKGLRTIVVENRKFYWKFTGKIFVSPDEDTNSLLIIDFGWYDIWDYAGSANKPPDFEPQIATPKFVAASIAAALKLGWTTGKMVVLYRNGEYTLETTE